MYGEVPQQRGELAELRSLVNISSETWPLVVGWLVAALVPNVPHPILLLGGQQGSGKTTAARSLVGLIDPSPAQLRSQPRDPETWAISASASWVVAVDNISTISVWWSDSLCKAVTGDGWLRRKLYTDGDLAVLSFRRVVLLTSIDPGALRGDLGARVLLVDLEPIDETARQTDRDLAARYEAARPRILGAILDLLVRVMAELANVRLERHPRMADFGRLLAAVDRAADNADNRALEIYVGQLTRIAETVIESDPVALAIESLMEEEGHWEGTAGQLLAGLTPERPPKDWPRTPQGMGGRLKRLIPALKQAGIHIEQDRAGHQRTRLYHITRCPADGEGNPSSATSALSAGGENGGKSVTSTRTSADDCGQPDGGDCPPETTIAADETWRADDADDLFRSSSGDAVSARPASLRGLCSGRLSSEEVRQQQERERPSRPTIGTGESGHED